MLSIITVGWDRTVMSDGNRSIITEPVQYVRGQQIDALRNRSMLAVKIERHLVRFIEPVSDVLDTGVFDACW